MRIEIEIPEEFKKHFEYDKFEDSLRRLILDANCMAGNYEKETAEMLINAFKNSKPAYNVENVIKEIHGYFEKAINDYDTDYIVPELLKYNKGICGIVRKGGINE